MMESSISFQYSLRECAETIQAMCLNKDSEKYLTYDAAALRLWTAKKQVKSLRLDAKYKELAFLNMSSVDELDAVLLWLGPRKASAAAGGALLLVSFDLTLLQEVPLSLRPVEKFSACLQQTEFVAVDKHQMATVFHVAILAQVASTPVFSYNPKRARPQLIALRQTQTIDLAPFALKDLQIISEDLIAAVGSGAIQLYSRRPVAPAAAPQAEPGHGEGGDEVGLSALRKRRRAKEGGEHRNSIVYSVAAVDPGESSTPAAPAAPAERAQLNRFNANQFVHTGVIPMAYNSLYKHPTVIRQVGPDKLLVGFDDGTVQIVICSALAEAPSAQLSVVVAGQPASTLIAAKLCEFQAHAVTKAEKLQSFAPHRRGVLAACSCPWAVLCGGSGYVLELLTIGSDNRLAHWGVRQKDAHSSVTFVEHSYAEAADGDGDDPGGDLQRFSAGAVLQLEYPMEVDLLGEFAMPLDPAAGPDAPHARALVQRAQMRAFEATLTGTLPVQRRLVCSFGGMLLFFAVGQPHRRIGHLPAWQQVQMTKSASGALPKVCDASERDLQRLVVSSCRGPDLSPMRFDGAGQTAGRLLDHSGLVALLEMDPAPESSVLFLRGEAVDIVSIESGALLMSLPTSHLAERLSGQPAVPAGKKFSSPLVRGSVQGQEERELEGRPCCVHWCNLSQLLVVGYSAGGVGVMSLDVSTAGYIHAGATVDGLRSSASRQSQVLTHVQSRGVHDAEISVAVTFRMQLSPAGKAADKAAAAQSVVALLLGDKSGQLSLWQLSPQRTSSAALLSSGQHHLGAIVHAHSCVLDVNAPHRLLVTGCSLGTLKVWKLEPHGALTLVAFLNTTSVQSVEAAGTRKLTSLLVLLTICIANRDAASDERDSLPGQEGAVGLKSAAEDGDRPSPQLEHQLVCVCGFSSGAVETWVVSTNRRSAFPDAAYQYRDNVAPISKLVWLPRESGSNLSLQGDCESVFLPHESADDEILCTCVDGTVVTLGLSAKGELRRLSYFSLAGSRLHNVVANYSFLRSNKTARLASKDQECVLVGDFCGFEVLLCARSKVVPPKWHHPYIAPSHFSAMPELLPMVARRALAEAGSGLSRHEFDLLPIEAAGQDDLLDSWGGDPPQPGAASSLEEANGHGSHLAQSSSSLALLGSSRRSVRSEKRQQFVGSMESMQRIVSSELHFAKKDQRLLELFVQHCPASDGTVSPETTVDIVFAWLASDKISQDTIWQLFRMLEIQAEDRLKFIEVAKIAAVVASAMQRTGETAEGATRKGAALQLPYKKMKSGAVKVTYNSMGERVFQRTERPAALLDGIYDGLESTIRRVWKKQECRVLTRAESEQQLLQPLPVRLAGVPPAYKSLLVNRLQPLALPTQWSPADPNWFDPWRALRIARTLFDIRSSKQHEVFRGAALGRRSAEVEGFPRLLAAHFETTYGESRLNVAHQKALHYLEACLQYQHHPLLNVLSRILGLDPRFGVETVFESAVWLCVEARSLLTARGAVMQGALIQPYSGLHNYPEVAVHEGVAQQVRWQCVSKGDALHCADELLRLRGQFGPTVYLHVFQLVRALPPVSATRGEEVGEGQQDPEDTSALVDLERFLEILFFELQRFEQLIRDREASVFGDNALAVAIPAVSRDINSKGRPKLVIDDQDFQFGPHHGENLGRVKALLLEFVRCDPVRTGVLDPAQFSAVVRRVSEDSTTLGRGNRTADVVSFMRICSERYRDAASADGQLSYIDCVAMLLAWESHTQGEAELCLAALNEGVPQILRSIETAQARDLITYFGCIQTLPSRDPLWTMGSTGFGQTTSLVDLSQFATGSVIQSAAPAESAALQISRAGNWSMGSQAPAEEPGQLLVRKVVLAPADRAPPNRFERDVRDKELRAEQRQQPAPQILQTSRALSTVYGETLRPLQLLTAGRLTLHVMSPLGLDAVTTHSGLESDLSRSSYSRSVARAEAGVREVADGEALAGIREEQEQGDSQAPRSPNAMRFTSQDAIDNAAGGRTIRTASPPGSQRQLLANDDRSYNLLRGREDSVATNDSNYEHFSISFGGSSSSCAMDFASNNELNHSLALDEAQARLGEMHAREGELELLLAREREVFAARQAAKEKQRADERRALSRKEREGLAYMERSLDERSSRNQAARDLAASAEAAAEREKREKELEIQRIVERNRARLLQRQDDKLSAQQQEEEQRRELRECGLMGKEEELCARSARAVAEQQRREAEEAARREQEEFESQISQLQAQLVVEGPAPEVGGASLEDLAAAEEDPEDDAGLEEEEEEEDGAEEQEDQADEPPGEEVEEPAQVVHVVTLTPSVDLAVDDDTADDQAEGVAVAPMPLTAAQRRVQQFLDNLHTGNEDHRTHPRRPRDGFFMAQRFSEDIVFQPFAAACSNFPADPQEPTPRPASVAEEQSSSRGSNPFADIAAAIKTHKRRLEKARKLMFSTSLDDVPSRDWMALYRTGYVDWDHFFRAEQRAIEAHQTAQRQSAQSRQTRFEFRAEDFLGAQALADQHDRESVFKTLTQPNGAAGRPIPQSLLDMPDDLRVEITPLPFGKVLEQRVVLAGAYKYFQVEVAEAGAMLTVEVRCRKGLANLYVARGQLPSALRFDQRAACTKANDRLARVSFVPPGTGTYLLAAHSPESGAQFDIWAYASDDPAEDNPRIAHVTSLLRKFRYLAAHEEELAIHFPRLEVEAAQLAEGEEEAQRAQQRARRAVYLEMRGLEGSDRLQTLLHDAQPAVAGSTSAEAAEEQEQQEDTGNMEMFVVKAGRYAMRQEVEMLRERRLSGLSTAKADVIYDVRGPNMHADLFSRPALPSRSHSMALLQPLNADLSAQEELRVVQEGESMQAALAVFAGSGSHLRASSMMDFYSRTLARSSSEAAGLGSGSHASSTLKLPSIDSARQLNSLQHMYTHLEPAGHSRGAPTGSRRVEDAKLQQMRRSYESPKPVVYKLRK